MRKIRQKYLQTYLAGPMEAVPDSGIQWRERITPKLLDIFKERIKIVDPCKSEASRLGALFPTENLSDSKEILRKWKASGHWELFDTAIEAIIKTDLASVVMSDFIIVYLDFSHQMGGTISEITTAYLFHIPIYAVLKTPVSEANSWIIGMCRIGGEIFDSFNKLLEKLSEDYKEFIQKEEGRC